MGQIKALTAGDSMGVGLALALAVWVWALRFPLNATFFSQDEGLYLAVAQAMLDGKRLYTAVWDNKPVGIFLIYAGIIKLLGASLEAIRFASSLAVFGCATLLFALVRAMGGRTAAVFAAFLFPAYMLDIGADGAQAESFMILPQTLSLLVLMRDLRRRYALGSNLGAAFLFGLLQGVAFQIKFPAAFAFFLIGAALFVATWYRAGRLVPALLAGVVAGLGFAVCTALVFLYFALTGGIGDMVFATFVSPRIYVGSPFGMAEPVNALVTTVRRLSYIGPLLLAAAAGALVWLRSERRPVVALQLGLLLAWLVGGVLTAMSAGYFRYFYFIVCTPPAIALAALAIERLLARYGRYGWCVGFVLLAAYPLGSYARKLPQWIDAPGTRLEWKTLAFAKSLVRPGEVAFFADLHPILYPLTGSVPASRYPMGSAHIFVYPERFRVDPAEELNAVFDRQPEIVLGTRMRLGPDGRFATAYGPRLQEQYELVDIPDPQLRDEIIAYRRRAQPPESR